MKKLLGALCVALTFASVAPAMASDIEVGSPVTGNCYPFLCNDTGTSTGLVMDYEQVYSATQFYSPTILFSVRGYFDQALGGTGYELGGSYNVYLGYAAHGSVNNLSTDLASNFLSTPSLVFSYSIPDHLVNVNPLGSISFNGYGGFYYDPSLGDLLFEVQVFDQNTDPNPNERGYLFADDTGSVTSRAYCGANIGCVADSTGLFVIFDTSGFKGGGTTDAPEPASIALLGSGLFLLRRRKITA